MKDMMIVVVVGINWGMEEGIYAMRDVIEKLEDKDE